MEFLLNSTKSPSHEQKNQFLEWNRSPPTTNTKNQIRNVNGEKRNSFFITKQKYKNFIIFFFPIFPNCIEKVLHWKLF